MAAANGKSPILESHPSLTCISASGIASRANTALHRAGCQ